jgi:ribosomal protein S18 acetylase RimI-like enzyme
MNHIIEQSELTPELKDHIEKEFNKHAFSKVGMDGFGDLVVFQIKSRGLSLGSIVARIFWGQLKIIYLIVDENYRSQGIGETLINHALKFGKEKGCTFAFLETMSFQAPEFYQKLGFKVDFVREGYAKNTSFIIYRSRFHNVFIKN